MRFLADSSRFQLGGSNGGESSAGALYIPKTRSPPAPLLPQNGTDGYLQGSKYKIAPSLEPGVTNAWPPVGYQSGLLVPVAELLAAKV